MPPSVGHCPSTDRHASRPRRSAGTFGYPAAFVAAGHMGTGLAGGSTRFDAATHEAEEAEEEEDLAERRRDRVSGGNGDVR